jgi:aryl-alcohol dehydrogenase-like predicted oxidoreductase
MEYRPLGRSGLKVSALSLGTMTFGAADPSRPVGSVGRWKPAGTSTCASKPESI